MFGFRDLSLGTLIILGPSDYSSGSGGWNSNLRQRRKLAAVVEEVHIMGIRCCSPIVPGKTAVLRTAPLYLGEDLLSVPLAFSTSSDRPTQVEGGSSTFASLSGVPNITVMQGSNPAASAVVAISGADNQRVVVGRAQSKRIVTIENSTSKNYWIEASPDAMITDKFNMVVSRAKK
nr:hypothetical protein HmN_000595400 [Hymenolepis microstoma]